MLNLFNFFTMNIILLEHIEKVGAKHDVVKVKDGYGRNYLIPKGLAIVANKPNLARLEGLKKQAAKKEGAIIAAFKEVAAKLAGAKLSIAAKAGESGRLFGSVSAQNISAALKELGIDADKRGGGGLFDQGAFGEQVTGFAHQEFTRLDHQRQIAPVGFAEFGEAQTQFFTQFLQLNIQ